MASGKLTPAPRSPAQDRGVSTKVALAIFAVLVTTGPLAFGAVDRICQIALAGLLALGLLVHPPAVAPLRARSNALILAALGVLLIKEFGPASWFGATFWRHTLTESYGLPLPWTHHPEPARALEALLAGTLAVLWFLWVRTLAHERENRPALLWSLFASAAIVAGVSFATAGMDPMAIYGLRYTPGWVGFGPFPNRNHTACLLAMGLVLGAGCIAWAGSRRKYALTATGAVLFGLVLAGLLGTRSRGGLVVATVGFALFFALVFLKFRNWRTLGVAFATALILGALGLAFGAPALARFTSQTPGIIPDQLRVAIWQDALGMWQDAPLFGHGLHSFTQLFPLYQKVETGGAIVLHPESSWLQWLNELGLIPVAIGVAALLIFAAPRLRRAFTAHSSFFLLAAGFAAAGTLLVHALFDVPAHRWGTAAFALAALAVACAPAERVQLLPAMRRAALVPLGIAGFWALPFLYDWPAWSPLTLARLLAREQTTPFVPLAELQRTGRYFPLNGALHQAIGMHELEEDAPGWQREFRLAARLMPGSWEVSADQARASARVSPGMALHHWQLAIERAGHRAEEVFGTALAETSRLPGANTAWSQYAETHPELLLAYAQLVPGAAAGAAYQRWWEERGAKPGDLPTNEVEAFYRLAPRWGTKEQLDRWMRLHPEFRARDFKPWAQLLTAWGADADAWQVLAAQFPDPAFLPHKPRGDLDHLRSIWEVDSDDLVNAQDLARLLTQAGRRDEARTIILEVANRPASLDWFRRKAAHLLAAEGRHREAAALLLRAPAG